jgi:hypothetical protein
VRQQAQVHGLSKTPFLFGIHGKSGESVLINKEKSAKCALINLADQGINYEM